MVGGCWGSIAEALHIAWRVALNLMAYISGIATRPAAFVKPARAVSPNVSVVTTRKAFPGTRSLMMTAIIAGGALPHRLGLNDSQEVQDGQKKEPEAQ